MCLLWKFNKYTLTGVFLHAEFISAMKTMQNLTFFMKTQKKKKNYSFLLIEIFTETLEQIVTQSYEILILDGKEDK